MLQEEFKRLTDKPFTEEEFEKIHYVYIFYPGIVTRSEEHTSELQSQR